MRGLRGRQLSSRTFLEVQRVLLVWRRPSKGIRYHVSDIYHAAGQAAQTSELIVLHCILQLSNV